MSAPLNGLIDPRGIWVKVDGVTRAEDVDAAIAASVSAVGVIFCESSRRVTLDQAREIRAAARDVPLFGVFDGSGTEDEIVASLKLEGVQLPASSPWRPRSTFVLRTVRVRDAADLAGGVDGLLHLDAYVPGRLGGTGVTAPWDVIEADRPSVPFVLSGGLTPDNVAEAVHRLKPAGVDVSGGVESAPGVKDPAKMRAFVEAARGA